MSAKCSAVAAAGLLSLIAQPVLCAPDPAGSAAVFRDAKAISERDGGALWGHALYGPMLLVDPTDSSAVANQPDADGVLRQTGSVHTGTLPPSVLISNTPIEWAGSRWTELIWPLENKSEALLRTGDAWRQVMLAHEMFHRIQPGLGLTRPEGANEHLDTLDGRYLLQLEWRALAQALAAPNSAGRRRAISDAIQFRRERYRIFPEAATEENSLEINEGVPEYTGVRLGLTTAASRTSYAIADLSAFLDAPTFVRSFAYATGPAYGLLLDEADPAWRGELSSGRRLDQLLSAALKLAEPSFADLKAREAVYDDGRLRSREVARDKEKQVRLATLKARLVDGPRLILPLHHANYQFNPQTLTPLGVFGIVYPTIRLTSDWGALEVEAGGALIDKEMRAAAVTAVGIDPAALKGDGWRLTLNTGWSVQPGPRTGDFTVKDAAGNSH